MTMDSLLRWSSAGKIYQGQIDLLSTSEWKCGFRPTDLKPQRLPAGSGRLARAGREGHSGWRSQALLLWLAG